MNWKDIKKLIRRELNEATTVDAGGSKFNLRTGVNKNPTKLGIKIQFEPQGGVLGNELKGKLEVALQEKLNTALAEYDIQVSKDTDVPRYDVIGFFIPLSQVKNLIVEALGGKAEDPSVPAPEPETSQQGPTSTDDVAAPVTPVSPAAPTTPSPEQMVNEQLINEMRVRDLNEISKVIMKDDFYAFINAGNNVLRSLEENGRSVNEAKKYLGYLVKHNIM